MVQDSTPAVNLQFAVNRVSRLPLLQYNRSSKFTVGVEPYFFITYDIYFKTLAPAIPY